MSNLQILELNKNEIVNFFLETPTPLKRLNLSNNCLSNSPSYYPTLSLEYAGATLTDLNLSYNTDLECLDMRDLVNLEYLTLNDNPVFASIFICMPEESQSTLKNVNISNCALTNFYPVSLPQLTSLNLSNNVLMTKGTDSPFVMGNYPKLQSLSLAGNKQVAEIDVSKCPELEQLHMNDCSLSYVDVSQCPKLYTLSVGNNNIRSLDLGNNPDMKNIYVYGNPMTELDVSQFLVMSSIDISNTQISRVDLMNLYYLQSFVADNTPLEFVDFNGQQPSRMYKISLKNCKSFTPESMAYTLKTLPPSKKTYATNLFLEGSNAEHCDIETLTGVDYGWMCDISGDGTVLATNLEKLSVTLEDATDTGVNKSGRLDRLYPNMGLSLDYDLDVMQTEGGQFILAQWQPEWFQTVASVSTEAYEGVPMYVKVYPEEGKRFRSVTVNGKEIFSQWFMVTEPNSTIQVNFGAEMSYVTFDVPVGNDLSFLVNVAESKNNSVWVDWGTGTRTEYPNQSAYSHGVVQIGGTRIDGTAAGSKVTVYGDLAAVDVSGFGDVAADMGLWDNHVTAFDASNAPDLKLLNLYWNPVTTLDLSSNKSLEVLNISYTNLPSVDLSGVNLYYLEAYSDGFDDAESGIRGLNSIDVSHMSNLQYLDVHNNNLSAIDVTNNPYLIEFKANGNNLTSVDVSKNSYLEVLNVANNKLGTIDVSSNPELWDLTVSRNQLTGLDLSNNVKLVTLSIDNNNIHFIDLHNQSELQMLYLNGNGMTAGELNDIYYLLPQRKDLKDDADGNKLSWNIAVIQGGDVAENEGRRADSSIAIDRNWSPSHTGTNGGCDVAYLDIITPVHGTIKVSDAQGNEYGHGSKVTKYLPLTITATPDEGWHYASYRLNEDDAVESSTFEMPGIYTKLRANFAYGSGVNDVECGEVFLGTRHGRLVVEASEAMVSVYSMSGQVYVDSQQVIGSAEIALPTGMYIVRVRTSENTISESFIIK